MSLEFDADPTMAPTGHGLWTEGDIDRAWRAVLDLWPEDDARAAAAVSAALAARLTPAEFDARLRDVATATVDP